MTNLLLTSIYIILLFLIIFDVFVFLSLWWCIHFFNLGELRTMILYFWNFINERWNLITRNIITERHTFFIFIIAYDHISFIITIDLPFYKFNVSILIDTKHLIEIDLLYCVQISCINDCRLLVHQSLRRYTLYLLQYIL